MNSVLLGIPGVGPASQRRLLEAFGSPERILNAGPEELTKVLGPSRAAKVLHFQKNQTGQAVQESGS
jgi:excinuclease UvrABC nuclease subunit